MQRHASGNRLERIDANEIEQLGKAAASSQDRAIYRTAAFTGLRMGELIALRWSDVHFTGEALHVCNSYSLGTSTAPKSGLTRTVPTAGQAQKLLEADRKTVPNGRDQLAFPGERGEYLDRLRASPSLQEGA